MENPYKANQYVPDPRQQICWDIFLKGWMKGEQNAAKAAREAGYSETTSAVISNQTWFKDKFSKLRRKEFLSKGERNIDKILDLDYSKIDSSTGEKTEIDIDKLKIVADMSKLIVTTLGKDDGYSTKTLTDQRVSGTVNIKAINYADQVIEEPKEVEVIDITGEEI